MPIKIIRPGIFSTIQDTGRIGYRSVGIGPGGAMDSFALSVANFLAGNEEDRAVIEMHFPAAEIVFEEDALISITGGNFNPCINDMPVSLWKPVMIKKNERLAFKKFTNGARVYLALHGGIDAHKWLNSFSTHTKVKAGGYKGRPLLKEDTVLLNKLTSIEAIENFPGINALVDPVYLPANIIRCIAGPEWDLLSGESKNIFSRELFSITGQSDRMGYRLKGLALDLKNMDQLISSPVDYGTVQLLPDGQLVVLMADHQTTGGYPRIANVISADLPKLAQLPIHVKLQFELATIEYAEEALLSLYQKLESIKNTCIDYYASYRHQL